MSIINHYIVLYAYVNIVSLLSVYMLCLHVYLLLIFSSFDLCTLNAPMMFLLILFLSQ